MNGALSLTLSRLARARVELGAEAADAAWQERRGMEFERAVEEALEEEARHLRS
jgi:hypothetical protein